MDIETNKILNKIDSAYEKLGKEDSDDCDVINLIIEQSILLSNHLLEKRNLKFSTQHIAKENSLEGAISLIIAQ